MKLIFLLTSATAMIAISAFAQNAPPRPPSVPPPPPGGLAPSAPEGGNPRSDAPRFDLKFPGGPAKEFVASVAKALGKPINVIIPNGAETTVIPAVEVYRVTVPALFRALGAGSQRQVAVRIGGGRNFGGGGGGSTYQYQNVGFSFSSNNEPPDSPDAVWTFQVVSAAELPDDAPVSGRVVQYYPVAEYLSHFSVEDITTAIEAGWNLQRESEPNKDAPPTIKFHEETKLLICAGSNRQISEIIPQVLTGLSQMLRFPRTDNLKITRKAKEIIIPKVEFRDATILEAIDFIRGKAVGIDPQKQGINILLNAGNVPVDQRVSLNLTDIPVLEVLRFIAELAKLDLEIRDTAIVLKSAPTDETAAAVAPALPPLGAGGGSPGLPPIAPGGSSRTPPKPPRALPGAPPPTPSVALPAR